MIELNKIYNEDCLDGMKRIPDGSVDMVLCHLSPSILVHLKRNSQQKDMELSNYNLIKYYQDTVIAVSLKLEGDEMTLKTWYVLRDSGKRKGLLIKRKQ